MPAERKSNDDVKVVRGDVSRHANLDRLSATDQMPFRLVVSSIRQHAGKIQAKGGKASIHQVDVTDQAQVNRLIGEVVSQHGLLDVMVSNAGLMAIAPLSLRKTDEWDRMIDMNIKGLLYGIAAALPVLKSSNQVTSSTSRRSWAAACRMTVTCIS